jgi:uncharacterized membrane protein
MEPSTVALVGILSAAALAAVLFAVERPPVTRRTVLAAAPWAVAAGVLHALATVGAYPPALAPFFQFPGVFIVAFVVGTLVWIPLLQLAAMRDYPAGTGQYLAAAGSGLSVVLLVVLLLRQGIDPDAMLWLVATPFLGAVLSAVLYFMLGFVDATTLSTTRWVGFLVVFGHAVLGTTFAVSVDAYGVLPGWPVDVLVALGRELPTAPTSTGWPVAVAAGVLGLVIAVLVARVIRESTVTGYGLAVAVAAVSLGPAISHLLLLTVG